MEFKSESITLIQKHDMQQQETVEQYLKRGGTVTQYSPAPNGIKEGAGLLENGSVDTEPQIIRSVPWKELYAETDPELDDPKYWKELNEKLDKILEKNKG